DATAGATESAAGGEPPATGPEEPRPKRQIELTRRQKLERAIVDFPEGVDNYLQLAQLHLDEQRPAEAERVLVKAVAVSGGDIAVRERLEDATAERIRQQLAVAEQRAEAKQTEEAYKLAEEIRHNLARYEMELLQARAERYPQDPELKFQLGRRLKRLGNYQEAAAQLQHAQESPQLKASARLEMGECLQHLKQYPKALLAYERAIDAAEAAGQTEVLKLALYRAGVLATALRQLESAQRHLEALERLDAQFKDLADRLDKLRQIRHKG
ncbi:MAG: hypothetical protein J5I93_18000, partial [Pirellulaceae bacterium]|nr:hypothetical protein [Pirellulaceae bacterium]